MGQQFTYQMKKKNQNAEMKRGYFLIMELLQNDAAE